VNNSCSLSHAPPEGNDPLPGFLEILPPTLMADVERRPMLGRHPEPLAAALAKRPAVIGVFAACHRLLI
jgi:hypothetical protein